MRATTLLQNQHREVEALFEALETATREDRLETGMKLATALAGHMVIEEELFYPAAMKDQKDRVLGNQEEHELAASTLKRLLEEPTDEATCAARARVLRRMLEEHIQEEEEQLFPTFESMTGDEELEALGEKMEQRFQEVTKAGPEAALAMRPSAKAGQAPMPGGQQQPGQQQPGQQQPGRQQQPGQRGRGRTR